MSREQRDEGVLLAPEELRLLLGGELLAYLQAQGLAVELRLSRVGGAGPVEVPGALPAQVGEQLIALQRLVSAGEMAAGLIHEVRNIAASVRGFAQVAQERVNDPAELAPLLQTIARESARCADRLNEYLRFAVVRRQRERRLVPVSAVLLAAVDLVRHDLVLHEIELVVDVARDLPPVRVDIEAVQQVLLNLFLNARQAIGRQGRVAVAAAAEAGAVVIRVSDSGGGVAPEVEHRLFQPFVTTKAGGKGSGLGLAIARDVMREHGGDLLCENAPGVGATFVLHLPAAAPGGGDG